MIEYANPHTLVGDDRWLTIPEVARVLERDPRTVTAALRRNEIKAYPSPLGTKTHQRVPISEVRKAIERSGNPARLLRLLDEAVLRRWGA